VSSESQIYADPPEFLRGFIRRVTFHSEDTGFAVIQLEPDADLQSKYGEKTTIVGRTTSAPHKGEYLLVKGDWKQHPKFGRQFAAVSISSSAPRSRERFYGSSDPNSEQNS